MSLYFCTITRPARHARHLERALLGSYLMFMAAPRPSAKCGCAPGLRPAFRWLQVPAFHPTRSVTSSATSLSTAALEAPLCLLHLQYPLVTQPNQTAAVPFAPQPRSLPGSSLDPAYPTGSGASPYGTALAASSGAAATVLFGVGCSGWAPSCWAPHSQPRSGELVSCGHMAPTTETLGLVLKGARRADDQQHVLERLGHRLGQHLRVWRPHEGLEQLERAQPEQVEGGQGE
eukprot:scaffold24894_cov106-Isochrysis_galbana.AAC.5